jgi:hypothetical protein
MTGNAVFGTRVQVGTGWTNYLFMGSGDMTGDGRADIVARDSGGTLWLYPGNGAGGVGGRTSLGTGFNTPQALLTPGNWDRANGNDMITRETNNLFLYPGNNASAFLPRVQIATGGWSVMNYIG